MPTSPTRPATSPRCSGTSPTVDAAQGQAFMTALSGQNYSGFSTSMVQGAQLFMNNFADQTGGGSRRSSRVALAEACDVACDTPRPPLWGAWGGALGGLGTIGAGTSSRHRHLQCRRLRRRPRPPDGAATSRRRDGGLHHRHAMDRRLQRPGHVRHLPGRPLWRLQPGQGLSRRRCRATPTATTRCGAQIAIPGLRPRTAQGQTGANQFFGQLEGGYRFDLGGAGRRLRHAVRPPAGLHRHAERLQRDRRAVAQPHRRRPDHQLAALGARRAARRRDRRSAGAKS